MKTQKEDIIDNLILQDNIEEIKKIEDSQDIEKPKYKQKLNEEICNILWVKPDEFAIDFRGYGISINGNISSSLKTIKIKYKSDIGFSDFKIVGFE